MITKKQLVNKKFNISRYISEQNDVEDNETNIQYAKNAGYNTIFANKIITKYSNSGLKDNVSEEINNILNKQ